MKVNLLWFRRDLRLADNEAATAAAACESTPVLPFFIVDPWFYDRCRSCWHRSRFLFEALTDLDAALRARGSRLYLFLGNSVEVFQQLARSLQTQRCELTLFYNWDVQAEYGLQRDRQIEAFCKASKILCRRGRNNFIQLQSARRDCWRDEYYAYLRAPLFTVPERIAPLPLALENLPQLALSELEQFGLGQQQDADMQEFVRPFRGGASRARATLDSFLQARFQGYHWKLSQPWHAQQGGSSHLSPHISFGCISTREIYQRVKARAAEFPARSKPAFALKNFRDRLRWRDSALQRFYHRPQLARENLYPEFDCWYASDRPLDPEKQDLFEAWQEGMTGFPLVDASMRQLKAMGWMNFRMRAMCATFLTINCGISWHHGAEHYMHYLVDGDLAIDHWQWQSQAGVANPLSATFRIYNPTKNLIEKDAQLKFVTAWVPELRGYQQSEILAGQNLSEGYYPLPILDWSATRRQHGKIVSDLRKATRERLKREGGSDHHGAQKLAEASKKYREARDRQYRDLSAPQEDSAIA